MASWTRKQVAATIDHAALKAEMTDRDIADACELGTKCRVASVCVRPSDVALAARLLHGSGVVPSMVVGFPHGAHRPEVKALEARLGIEDGARELDMVMNVGKFLSGDHDWVRRDIQGVVAEAKKAGNVLVKVILETCYLNPEQIAAACRIAREAGADFVKTSTGFGSGPATPEAIDVMIRTVGDTMGVKASGGVRSYEVACAFLDQGCKRLGSAGGTAAILGEAPDGDGGDY
ncbi:MAG: deoxyribose-phosphate aldolase [Thermoguttaceae bacterium]